MKFSSPKNIVGNRKCIESEDNDYIITRYMGDDNAPYIASYRRGCHWSRLGGTDDIREAKKIIERHQASTQMY